MIVVPFWLCSAQGAPRVPIGESTAGGIKAEAGDTGVPDTSIDVLDDHAAILRPPEANDPKPPYLALVFGRLVDEVAVVTCEEDLGDGPI